MFGIYMCHVSTMRIMHTRLTSDMGLTLILLSAVSRQESETAHVNVCLLYKS